MIWRREIMLRTGRWPSQSRRAATVRTTTSYQAGGPDAGGGVRGRWIADTASTMVIQFSQEKLPDRTSHSWVAIIRVAAAVAMG